MKKYYDWNNECYEKGPNCIEQYEPDEKGCRHCPNHPSNGGSGICHCIIGTQPIMCNSTANNICDAIEKDKLNVSDELCSAIGNLREKEVYNACCDNHIKIIHDMMTGASQISVDTKGSISSDSN